MMRFFKYLLFIFLLTAASTGFASHLVGGEFQMKYVGNFTYDIQLNVYGDVAGLSGPTGNEDPFVDISTFSKATNKRVETIRMYMDSSDFVPYTNVKCQNGSISTKVLVYRIRWQFQPSLYGDQAGYYMSWERCCRNIAIGNLVLPQNAGMVFYYEFPAVVKNSQPFINSSPILPAIPPEYLCAKQPYQYSMQATDADGDSLVYVLSEPLNGHTTPNTVTFPGGPAPYAPVNWAAGFNVNNMIQGTPPLTINSKTGLITVTPATAGLFVFAFTVIEFRKGVKIGEVRRDVQVKVNSCPTNSKPAVVLTPNPGSPGGYHEGDTLLVTDKTNFCYPIVFSDPDIGQQITVTVQPLNFTVKPLISPASGTVIQSGQTFNGSICWADCNLNATNQVYKVNLIVTDNACGSPAADTLQLTFLVIPTPNAKPTIAIQGPVLPVTVGTPFNFNVLSTDADNDQVTVSMAGEGFSPAALGMQFGPLTGTGNLLSNFRWTPTCAQAKLDTIYNLVFLVKDNSCFKDHIDTVKLTLKILPLANVKPTIAAPGVTTQITLGSAFNFNVLSQDSDNDQVTVSVSGVGFNAATQGIQFGPLTATGQLTSVFNWKPTCEQLKKDSVYTFRFVVKDNACFKVHTDTLFLTLKVVPVPNAKPEVKLDPNTLISPVIVNNTLKFRILSTDADNDQLTLKMTGIGFDPAAIGMQFGPLAGKGSITSDFSWTPTCDLVLREAGYDLLFILTDENCYQDHADSLKVHVDALPISGDSVAFLPPNVFTPNGDKLNDFFVMPNLPVDNCTEIFQEITIYSRWGNEVFKSASRAFSWDGSNVIQGTYFYIIRYNKVSYKGFVTILDK